MLKIYLFILVLILLYAAYLACRGFENIAENDMLNRKLLNYNGFQLSGWDISHIVMYFFIGMNYPEYWKEAMLLGIAWEVIETILGEIFTNRIEPLEEIKKRKKSKRKRNVKRGVSKKADSEQIVYKFWWSGRYVDLFSNALGFMMGVCVAYYQNDYASKV